MRILLKKTGCPKCLNYLGVIQKINFRLPVDKRIIIIDTTAYEEYGVAFNPLILHLKWEGTPTLFLDGNKVVGMTSPSYVKGYLEAYLEDELLW